MTSQVEGNEKGDELQKKFDDYKHPETNRLMSQVRSLISFQSIVVNFYTRGNLYLIVNIL